MARASTAGSAAPAPASEKGRTRAKVIYVMGAGHSGSTILGVALGNCAGVFFAGEVEEWLLNSGEPHLGGAQRTRFWSAVRENVAGAEPLFGAGANRYLERSSAALRIDRWSIRRRLRPQYRRVSEELYRTIARVADATHVVDTSHFPLRARELRRLEGIDFYVVLLTRNPQHVIASELRPISRHEVAERRYRTLTTNARLWLTHLLSVLVFLSHPRERRMFVRHEDLLADPQVVLRQLLDGVDCSAATPDLGALSTGVPLIGNKIIRRDVIALRTQAEEPIVSSRLTTLLQLAWLPIFSRLRPRAVGAASSEGG